MGQITTLAGDSDNTSELLIHLGQTEERSGHCKGETDTLVSVEAGLPAGRTRAKTYIL